MRKFLMVLSVNGLMGLTLLNAGPPVLEAQEPRPLVAELRVEPTEIRMAVGDTVALFVQPLDDEGQPVNAEFRLLGPIESLWLGESAVAGIEPGEYTLRVQLFTHPDIDWVGDDPPSVAIPVSVVRPGLERIEIEGGVGTLYQGTKVRHRARAILPGGSADESVSLRWSSSDPSVARVDRFGTVMATSTGPVTIRVEAEEVSATIEYEVAPFPAARLELSADRATGETGDVFNLSVTAYDENDQPIDGLPVHWSHDFEHVDERAAELVAGGSVRDGRFVAETPGLHTVTASAGPLSAFETFEIAQRDPIRELEVLGHGSIDHTRTTDFWTFEGVDGRDYAISGSKEVGAQAYVWDITDPAGIVLTDSILVDARGVNDVKVSPEGRYASMTREGASDRRNGVVILDLADPAHPVVATHHTEGLTGGVHNSFPTEDHLFALSGGEKYVIIDVTDIYNPRNVGEFHYPGARIHDVWVHNGIAYSAQRPVGVIAVDVGNGRWGGSPEAPVLINTTGPMPEGGGFHAVFPYASESTDRFYLFLGDEIMSRDSRWALQNPWPSGAYRRRYDPDTGEGGVPLHTAGYTHIVDFTDPEIPKKVARYQVLEYGTHNIWVEDDVLYQAYYEGGLRVVDVSGELMGNLYTQGREMAVFKSVDPEGYVANSTMVWSAMPFKGHVFFSDTNSGMWTVRIQPEGRPIS